MKVVCCKFVECGKGLRHSKLLLLFIIRVRLREDEDVFSSEELESSILLKKRWCRYIDEKSRHERCIIAQATKCQERALRKLKEESEELYLKAIQVR